MRRLSFNSYLINKNMLQIKLQILNRSTIEPPPPPFFFSAKLILVGADYKSASYSQRCSVSHYCTYVACNKQIPPIDSMASEYRNSEPFNTETSNYAAQTMRCKICAKSFDNRKFADTRGSKAHCSKLISAPFDFREYREIISSPLLLLPNGKDS